jgi:hypothetical protein
MNSPTALFYIPESTYHETAEIKCLIVIKTTDYSNIKYSLPVLENNYPFILHNIDIYYYYYYYYFIILYLRWLIIIIT